MPDARRSGDGARPRTRRKSASARPGKARSPEGPQDDHSHEDDFDQHSIWAAVTWPEIDVDVESIVSRIDMAQRHFERAAVDTRDQVGLAHGELKILLRLARGARSQGELTKALLVSTGTMTNQLDKLEGAGLVVRHPDPADRRGKVVEMTKKGREVLDNYINVQAKRERELVSELTEREKQELSVLLRKLMASLGKHTGGQPRGGQ